MPCKGFTAPALTELLEPHELPAADRNQGRVKVATKGSEVREVDSRLRGNDVNWV